VTATTERPAPAVRLTPPWTRRRVELTVLAVIMALLSVWSVWRVGFSPAAIVEGWTAMTNLIFGTETRDGMLPPRFDQVDLIIEQTFITFFMAIMATAIAAGLSFPLAFLAAANTSPNKVVRLIARGIIVMARTIPDLVFAAIFVRAFRIGPLAGILAIGLHAIGMCGKLLADSIEETDPGPREAIAATGGGWFQQMSTGVLPQVVPTYIGIVLYRLDINFRSSTVLGIVGAGGIGQLFNTYKGSLRWDLATGVVLFIIITVLLVEFLSARTRTALLGHDTAGQRRKAGGAMARLGEHFGRTPVSAADFIPVKSEKDPTAFDRVKLLPPWTEYRRKMALYTAGAIALVVASFPVTGISMQTFLMGVRLEFGDPGPGELPSVWNIALRLIPIELDPFRIQLEWLDDRIIDAMFETIAIGFAATAVGVALSIPLGYLAARNIAPNSFVYGIARGFMVAVRSIPDIVIAVIFVAGIGLGPLAGTLALIIGVLGFGAKFYADALEEVSEGPRDGVRSVGATRMQEVTTAVTPQFVPSLTSNSLYILDIMIRSSAVLGLVGAGGIGFFLFNAAQSLQFEVVGGLIILVFAVVFLVERVSDWARERLI
jgi:phosphonate transport system permease protein